MFPLLLAFLLMTASAAPAFAADEEANNGYAADTLTIKVGYYGGPYYEKAVFTLDQLWAMNVVYADYTIIDNMPSVVIDHVAGVRLSDLCAAAGIDIGSVQTFFFWTRDKQNDYYTSYTKEALIDTPRYCYYSLPDNWDEEAGKGNELATSYGEPVPTVIALADDWNRTIAGATFGSDYSNLDTNTRFRLIFGQTNGYERTASRSAKWIHEIVVELGGAPTLTLDDSVLDGEVGSVLRTQPSVTADSAILEQETVKWSSSDESVATVDEDGNITLHGEGTATITAEFAGVTATLEVTGIPGKGSNEGEVPPTTPPSDGPAPTSEPSPNPSSGGTMEAKPSANSNQGGTTGAKPSTNPKPSAAPTPVKPAPVKPVSEPEATSDPELQIREPEVETNTETGGVQNWRVFEMSETATELGNIESDNPLLGATGIASGALLILSGAAYVAIFYTDIRRGKHAYHHKPE